MLTPDACGSGGLKTCMPCWQQRQQQINLQLSTSSCPIRHSPHWQPQCEHPSWAMRAAAAPQLASVGGATAGALRLQASCLPYRNSPQAVPGVSNGCRSLSTGRKGGVCCGKARELCSKACKTNKTDCNAKRRRGGPNEKRAQHSTVSGSVLGAPATSPAVRALLCAHSDRDG